MKRKLISALTLAALALGMSASASADVVWQDDFNRANSNTVGNGWIEDEATGPGNNGNDVAIVSNRLQLRDNQSSGPDASATHLSISTAGFQDISVAFLWRPLSPSDPTDFLFAQWRLNGTSAWTNLTGGGLGLGGFSNTDTLSSFNLGPTAANSLIDFWFFTDVSSDNSGNEEGVLIDYVRFNGDLIPANNVPEPTSLLLLSVGLLGLGAARRRNK